MEGAEGPVADCGPEALRKTDNPERKGLKRERKGLNTQGEWEELQTCW